MNTIPSVRILHLEDDPDDAELISLRLRKEGLACEMTRVETRAAFQSALEGSRFDLVLADYRLPGFEGTSALKIVRDKFPGLPFIFSPARWAMNSRWKH